MNYEFLKKHDYNNIINSTMVKIPHIKMDIVIKYGLHKKITYYVFDNL